MYKSNTRRGNLYIHCCLITCAQSRGRGGGGGGLFQGGAYFKFWPIGGALLRWGLIFFWGGGGGGGRH